jgi:folylpolyglutamate synthase/dihydropteroate synthase
MLGLDAMVRRAGRDPQLVIEDNAAAVLTALASLNARLPVARAAIERGLRTVSLPGRFQRIECETEWILDVAHNPAAAKTLARLLSTLPARAPCIAVCGVLADKDLKNIYAALEDAFGIRLDDARRLRSVNEAAETVAAIPRVVRSPGVD